MTSPTSPFGKILGINVLVMLMAAIALKFYVVLSGEGDQAVFPILMAFYVVAHCAVDLLIAIGLGLARRRAPALAFLGSAPLMLLIGFGVCFGGSKIR